MAIDKTNVRKWVKALRSGNFKQTTGALRRNKTSNGRPVGFCCLGVACEASNLGVWRQEAISGLPGYSINKKKSQIGLMNPNVADWLGIPTNDRVKNEMNNGIDLKIRKQGTTLADLNDKKVSFKTIARLIEEQYLS